MYRISVWNIKGSLLLSRWPYRWVLSTRR